jgi:DNA repair protein RecO (recombination protein O)
MPSSRKAEALVLVRRNSREADRLLTLFSKSQGLIKVLAKGVRKIPSRRGGHLEPLTRVITVLAGTPGNYYLAGVEALDTYPALRQDDQAFRQGELLTHVMIQTLEEDHPYPQLYTWFTSLLEHLPSLPLTKRLMVEIAASFYILRCAGLLPQVQSCYICGTTRPHDAVILDAKAGGWRCLSCHTSFRGTQHSITPELLRALQWLIRYPEQAPRLKVTLSAAYQLTNAVRDYMATITGQRIPLFDLSYGR